MQTDCIINLCGKVHILLAHTISKWIICKQS